MEPRHLFVAGHVLIPFTESQLRLLNAVLYRHELSEIASMAEEIVGGTSARRIQAAHDLSSLVRDGVREFGRRHEDGPRGERLALRRPGYEITEVAVNGMAPGITAVRQYRMKDDDNAS